MQVIANNREGAPHMPPTKSTSALHFAKAFTDLFNTFLKQSNYAFYTVFFFQGLCIQEKCEAFFFNLFFLFYFQYKHTISIKC